MTKNSYNKTVDPTVFFNIGSTKTLIPCLGLSAPQAWIFWVNSIVANHDWGIAWQTVYAMLSIILVICAIASLKSGSSSKAILSRKASCASGTAGSLLLCLSCLTNDHLMAFCALALCALGLALAYIQWGAFYARIDIKSAILFLFASGMIAATIKTLAYFAPWPVEAAICCILPAISSVFNEKAAKSNPRPGITRVLFDKQNIAGLWKAAIAVVAFSAASAVLLATTPSPKETESTLFLVGRLLEALLCTGVLVLVFPLRKTFDFPRLWKAILVIVSTGILACIASPELAFQNVLASTSINFIVLFVWLTLSDIARHSSISPIAIFGIGWSCYAIPFFLGSAACIALGESTLDPARLSFVLYIVTLVAAFCLDQRDRDIALIFSDLDESHAEPSDFADIDNRCTVAAKQYSLTSRELEVMQHLCKGRSKAYIAEALFVTENTVKGHTKKIYSKLNVHSRKELQQLIDIH